MEAGFIIKFIRFCIVGGSGVVVDFGVTYALKEYGRLNKYLANSAGFLCAASSNYILNRLWTFHSTDPHVARQYLLFIGISLIGLAINNAVIWLLNDRLHIPFHRLIPHSAQAANRSSSFRDAEKAVSATASTATGSVKIDFYFSKLAAIAIVTLWNFLMNYFFNFG